MINRTRILVEGLNSFYAVDKLAKGGVTVLSAQKTQKNGVFIDLSPAEEKKAFAILRASCYNVKKVRYMGGSRLARVLLSRIGLLVGGALFLFSVLFAQTRVLSIQVVGSGACYEAEIMQILEEAGVYTLSAYPQNTAPISAKILSLPRVSYCELLREGGRLTVEVQVSDESAQLLNTPLYASISGIVEELTVLRGTPLVLVGDAVSAGDILVDSSGEDGKRTVVMASALLSFCEEGKLTASTLEQAQAQAELLYAGAQEITVEKWEGGWRVSGKVVCSRNLK